MKFLWTSSSSGLWNITPTGIQGVRPRGARQCSAAGFINTPGTQGFGNWKLYCIISLQYSSARVSFQCVSIHACPKNYSDNSGHRRTRDRWSQHSPVMLSLRLRRRNESRWQDFPGLGKSQQDYEVAAPIQSQPRQISVSGCNRSPTVWRTHNRIPQTTQLHVSRGADWSIGLFWARHFDCIDWTQIPTDLIEW